VMQKDSDQCRLSASPPTQRGAQEVELMTTTGGGIPK
jgi:hypothetical protein